MKPETVCLDEANLSAVTGEYLLELMVMNVSHDPQDRLQPRQLELLHLLRGKLGSSPFHRLAQAAKAELARRQLQTEEDRQGIEETARRRVSELEKAIFPEEHYRLPPSPLFNTIKSRVTKQAAQAEIDTMRSELKRMRETVSRETSELWKLIEETKRKVSTWSQSNLTPINDEYNGLLTKADLSPDIIPPMQTDALSESPRADNINTKDVECQTRSHLIGTLTMSHNEVEATIFKEHIRQNVSPTHSYTVKHHDLVAEKVKECVRRDLEDVFSCRRKEELHCQGGERDLCVIYTSLNPLQPSLVQLVHEVVSVVVKNVIEVLSCNSDGDGDGASKGSQRSEEGSLLLSSLYGFVNSDTAMGDGYFEYVDDFRYEANGMNPDIKKHLINSSCAVVSMQDITIIDTIDGCVHNNICHDMSHPLKNKGVINPHNTIEVFVDTGCLSDHIFQQQQATVTPRNRPRFLAPATGSRITKTQKLDTDDGECMSSYLLQKVGSCSRYPDEENRHHRCKVKGIKKLILEIPSEPNGVELLTQKTMRTLLESKPDMCDIFVVVLETDHIRVSTILTYEGSPCNNIIEKIALEIEEARLSQKRGIPSVALSNKLYLFLSDLMGDRLIKMKEEATVAYNYTM